MDGRLGCSDLQRTKRAADGVGRVEQLNATLKELLTKKGMDRPCVSFCRCTADLTLQM